MTLPFDGACSWCRAALAPPDEHGMQMHVCHQCYVLSILRRRDRGGDKYLEQARPGIVDWAEEQRAMGIMRGEAGWL